MPRYNWLSESQLQTKHLGDDLRALRAVGVPYTEDMIANASADALAQASPDDDTAGLVKRYGDATQIRSFDGEQRTVSEMDEMVAYLQILGKLSDDAHTPPAAAEEAPEAARPPRWSV